MEKKEWLELRKKGIGGSDAATVMGLNPWKSPLDLWLEKTGEYVDDFEAVLREAVELEKRIGELKFYALRQGIDVKNIMPAA